MGATPVSWLDIPVYTGNLEQLEKDITSLRKDAGKIRGTGADTHSTFQGLSAYYKAPETGQLLATTKPVRDRAEDFALQLEQVAGALDTYATEIRPLVKRLESLSSQALDFETEVEGDDNWDKDGAKTDRNNELLASVEAPVLVRVPGEAARLLGVELTAPVWWTELRAATAARHARPLAGTVATRLVGQLGGTVWPAAATTADGGARAVPGAVGAHAPAAEQPAVDVRTERAAGSCRTGR